MDFDRQTLIKAREACWRRYYSAVYNDAPDWFIEWTRLVWLRFACTLAPEVWGDMYMEARR